MTRSAAWRSAFVRWSNSPKVAAAFLLVVFLACAGGLVVSYQNATALRDHGIRTTAQVLEVHGGKNSYVLLSFEGAGQQVTAEVGNFYWDPEPRVGDRPTVLYDPADPVNNVADVRLGPDFLTPWLVGIGGFVAGALVVPTFRGRIDWKSLRR